LSGHLFPDRWNDRTPAHEQPLVAGIAIADPDLSLHEIASQLELMRERMPRGGRQWAASSVKSLLDQARRLGLAVHDPAPGS
jgi:hypothetical protein